MNALTVNEQILYSKSGKPKSVLLNYKTYKAMIELLEDAECINIIESRKKEKILSEEEVKKRIGI